MNKYLVILSVFWVILCLSLGEDADCEIDGHEFNTGESYSQPGACRLIECNGKSSYKIRNCFLQAEESCTYIPVDMTKSFPDCCPRNICPEPHP